MTTSQSNQLAVDNIRLAYKFARQRCVYAMQNGIEFDDLCAEMTIELVKCARTFNPDKGRFSTWAHKYMHLRFLGLLDAKTGGVRGDVRRRTHGFLVGDDGDQLDPPCYDTKETALVEARDILHPLLATLNDKERLVLHLRYWQNVKFNQIAELLGVSRQRVQQIDAEARYRMRHRRPRKPSA